MTSRSRNPPDSPGPDPDSTPASTLASLGWVSAHALAAGGSLAAWWLAPLARARYDAASMSHPDSGKQGDGDALQEFVKPFRAAEEHVDLIRKPVQPTGRGNVTGIGALLQGGLGGIAGAGLAGLGSPVESDPGSGKSHRPAAKGSAASLADGLSAIAAAGLGDLFNKSGIGGAGKPGTSSGQRQPNGSRNGSRNESRNPIAGSPDLGPTSQFPGHAHPATAKPAAATDPTSQRPDSRNGLPARSGARAVPPPARSAFAGWAEKVTRKLAMYASASGETSGIGKNHPAGSGIPAGRNIPPRQPPSIPFGDPETMARFKALLESQLAGTPGSAAQSSGGSAGSDPAAPGSAGGSINGGVRGDRGGNAVTPVSTQNPESDRKSGVGGPDLSNLVRELYTPVGNAPASPAAPALGRDPDGDNLYSPVQPPSPTRNGAIAPGGNGGTSLPAGSAPRVPTVTVTTVAEGTPLPGRGAVETEWLQEEDDLAAKLHRLLRRQAKRRGVDLA